jgi:membrane-associated protein
MINYGPLVLGLAMLPGSLGLPLPVGVLLIAAGALVRQGILDWYAVFLFAWLGAMLSDALTYTIGSRTGGWLRDHFSESFTDTWHQAEVLFKNRGGWAVFTTSCLIRGLAIPTNLIAGSSHYPLRHFIAWDAAGKIVWILLHAGLGYAFASQWQFVSKTINSYYVWLGLCAIVGIGIYLLLRRLHANQGRTVLGTG